MHNYVVGIMYIIDFMLCFFNLKYFGTIVNIGNIMFLCV